MQRKGSYKYWDKARRQLLEVKEFSYVGSNITKDGICSREIRFSIHSVENGI